MNRRKFHEIWIAQCDAAQEIKLRYGLKAAFDYVVAEKLLNFADAAISDLNSRDSCLDLSRALEAYLHRRKYAHSSTGLGIRPLANCSGWIYGRSAQQSSAPPAAAARR